MHMPILHVELSIKQCTFYVHNDEYRGRDITIDAIALIQTLKDNERLDTADNISILIKE